MNSVILDEMNVALETAYDIALDSCRLDFDVDASAAQYRFEGLVQCWNGDVAVQPCAGQCFRVETCYSVCFAVDSNVEIVVDHDSSIEGSMNIELDGLSAIVKRGIEGRKGILGCSGAKSAMGYRIRERVLRVHWRVSERLMISLNFPRRRASNITN